MEIKELLLITKNQGASDLHLVSGLPPAIRMNGSITPLKTPPFPAEMLRSALETIMNEHQREEYRREWEIDFAISIGTEARFRVNAFHTVKGPAAVFRVIPTKVQSLDELGLPEVLRKLTQASKGLILVTGPTGSGKSTTLAAMLNEINLTKSKHILTIEDPVEFVHQPKRSLINQRELGEHTKSFSRALRSALREDPDIILVGELRDYETISLALTAAETGHLVLGTLHTNSAAETVDRVIDVFPEGDKEMARTMFAMSIEGIITQLLVPTKGGKGRVAVHDILVATSAVRNLIRENKIAQIVSIMQVGARYGMQLIKDNVERLVHEGKIDKDIADQVLNISHFEEKKPEASGKEGKKEVKQASPSESDDF